MKRNRNNVRTLGWVAFFGGFGQDMIQPILPVFYSSVLGMSKEMIGLVEGSLTTIVSIFKILSGFLSDKLKKRKAIVFIGYLLSAVSRFLFGFASTAWQAFVLRFADGIGKGIKDAPRDALVAQSAKEGEMGFSFGYQRTLDTFGSVVGPLATAGLLWLLAKNIMRYRIIFYIGGLISAITLLLIVFFVKEKSQPDSPQGSKFNWTLLKGKFLYFLIIMLIFTLGNSSDSYLILRAQNVGVSVIAIPVVYALFNLFYALLSTPAGALSDKIGRVKVMQAGWLIYAIAYVGFALANQAWQIWIIYIFYGFYYATTEGIAKALVAHIVPDNQRGTAYGFFNASLGLMSLPANLIAGFLWDKVAPAATFYFGAACAIISLILLSFSKLERCAAD
ncbi:MFS transporter [Caproiciproducens galactitolivorans]|uniref:Multidrug resistance protein MdtG n=1 Tax=Caproiciproducens galactitolivorans TaxID=642589 RepID=A0A4Z0XYU8_9FIRM|nr:MFS transporter [Caproiciproducens galactitolivorans]QEY35068.1 MFS transporter [Caproiciproducens galactitolivorans]TGJ76709.1 multidrug resistance protein MdtG [Caproiciproducens galactitolivorans]